MTDIRLVLVDNATLSGVERLIGESQTANIRNIDNDILCLEKLITAIIFSDQIISVDDYKEKYRSDRSKKFNFINFLDIKSGFYSTISKSAADFASTMIFSFDGSKPTGDVVSFFEALRIYPQLRWDVFVSSEYLTLSLLVRDTRDTHYEASMDSVFRNEAANAEAVSSESDFSISVNVEGHSEVNDLKSLVQAFASGNPNYRGRSSNSLLERMVFGYGWAAERSYFYNAIAAEHGADAYLAPLRDAFCESCCRLESRSQVNSLLEALKSTSQETLAKIVQPSGKASFAVKLPFFVSYFISRCDNPRQCIEQALHLRQDPLLRDCRNILQNLLHLNNQDRYKEVNKILALLKTYCDKLMRNYGVSTGNGVPISLSIGLSGIGIESTFKLDRLFAPYRNRPFARFFRNIAQDMLTVERLGSQRDKLISSVREHRDANIPRISVTPAFMEHKESDSGRPAEI